MADSQGSKLFTVRADKVSEAITSSAARNFAKALNAVSKSCSVLACRTSSRSPRIAGQRLQVPQL